MKVDHLAALGAQLARGAASVSFAGDADFGARLTLGQIIKGRVLRSYEGGRHLVDFSGHERLVDSAVPLRPDEVFHGRVVGLGEQVQLQKLASQPLPNDLPATAEAPRPKHDSLAALFASYRAEVPAEQLELAAAAVARLPQPQTAATAALVLAKLALPLEPAWIKALHARLVGNARGGAERPSLWLESAAPDASLLEAAITPLAAALCSVMARPVSTASPATARSQGCGVDDGGDGNDDRATRDPAAWILNLQTQGAVAHRVGTLPLLVDGRLVELDVALFDEGGQVPQQGLLRHRQIVIGIETASLGRVEIRAQMVGQRMQVFLATAASDSTLTLSLHSQQLGNELRALGWQIDALNYATQTPDPKGAALHSVVEHIINPGSVSRLV